MNDKNYCVILAGGIGMKLWPSSMHQKPKQFIDFLGTGETLLQSTYNRISRFVDAHNIIVSTNEQYEGLVRQQLPQLRSENLLLEPMRRNTLPSATWATGTVSMTQYALMLVKLSSIRREIAIVRKSSHMLVCLTRLPSSVFFGRKGKQIKV